MIGWAVELELSHEDLAIRRLGRRSWTASVGGLRYSGSSDVRARKRIGTEVRVHAKG